MGTATVERSTSRFGDHDVALCPKWTLGLPTAGWRTELI
jgi:hypothetical protein